MSKLLFGTIFVNLSWQQSDIWLNSVLLILCKNKKTKKKKHEYVNELICIFEYWVKDNAQALSW